MPGLGLLHRVYAHTEGRVSHVSCSGPMASLKRALIRVRQRKTRCSWWSSIQLLPRRNVLHLRLTKGTRLDNLTNRHGFGRSTLLAHNIWQVLLQEP